jgi:hypothetical protein
MRNPTLERDIITEGWQWPAEEPPHSDKLSAPRVDEAEKQRWRELAAEEWRKAHAPSVEEVFVVEALSPEENRIIEAFRQQVIAAEEFEDKKRRGRILATVNLWRAFYDLRGRLERVYGQPARNEAERHFQDALALQAVANFLDRVGPVYLAGVADQFSRRAMTLNDEGIRLLGPSFATRSDPTLVWVPRAHVVLAVDTMHWVIDPMRGAGHTRESAAEWAAKLRPQLERLITESGDHRSRNLKTAIVSWCKDFSRRDGIKNALAVEVYSDGLAELKRWAPTRNGEEIERRAVWLLDRALLLLS